MKVYTLTIIKEIDEEHAEVDTTLYANPEDAIEAYNQAFDEAKIAAREYEKVYEDHEVATDTPYRWWSVSDIHGYHEAITIELDTKEVI